MTISSIGIQTLAIHAGMIGAFAAVIYRRSKRERNAAELKERRAAEYNAEIAEVGKEIKRQLMAAAAMNAPLCTGAKQKLLPGSRGMEITMDEFKLLCGGCNNGAE